MTRGFILIVTFLLLSYSTVPKTTINQTVDKFLADVHEHHFYEIDQRILSNDLSRLIKNVIKRSNLERKKVAGTTDKPLCIEGDIFSSIYEGWTTYQQIRTKVNSSTAVVTVEFRLDYNDTLEVWQDDIQLVKEETWKVDNVIFKAPGISGSTKKQLQNFIDY